MAYVKKEGLSDGEYPVIDRIADPEPWEAWRKYYVGRGMRFSARSLAKGGADRWTVPAKWPHEFDGSVA